MLKLLIKTYEMSEHFLDFFYIFTYISFYAGSYILCFTIAKSTFLKILVLTEVSLYQSPILMSKIFTISVHFIITLYNYTITLTST